MQPLSNEQRDSLAAELNAAAQKVWTQNEAGIWTIRIRESEPLSFEEAGLDSVTEELSNLSLTKIYNLNKTDGTNVYWAQLSNGQQIAIRRAYESGLELRSNAPYVCQAFSIKIFDGIKYEILPLIAMIDDGTGERVPPNQDNSVEIIENYDLFVGLFNHLSRISGYKPFKPLLEIDNGILPNGLPLQVDPGATKGRRDPNNIEQAYKLWEAEEDRLNLPENCRWMQDGRPVQETLFPNPFD